MTLVLCLFMIFADGMRTAPSAMDSSPVMATFIIGTIIALLIVASHWLPRIGW